MWYVYACAGGEERPRDWCPPRSRLACQCPFQALPERAGRHLQSLLPGAGGDAHCRGACPCSYCPFCVDRKEGSIWVWMFLKHPLNGLWAAAKSLSRERAGLRGLWRERHGGSREWSQAVQPEKPAHPGASQHGAFAPALPSAWHAGKSAETPVLLPLASCRLRELWQSP